MAGQRGALPFSLVSQRTQYSIKYSCFKYMKIKYGNNCSKFTIRLYFSMKIFEISVKISNKLYKISAKCRAPRVHLYSAQILFRKFNQLSITCTQLEIALAVVTCLFLHLVYYL